MQPQIWYYLEAAKLQSSAHEHNRACDTNVSSNSLEQSGSAQKAVLNV